jgi:predicted transcriptional regulator
MKYLPLTKAQISKWRDHLSASDPLLGPLEQEVLELVWQRGTASVRDIHLALDERLAYTTLMTTLDRLFKKGLLTRQKDGRAFCYSPRTTPEELARGLTRRALDGLLGRNPDGVEPLLACIVDAVTEHDRELLDDLDRLIQEKRRALEGNEQ